MSDVIIQGTNIHKIYDTGKIQVHALRGLDISVEKGEMISVMGASGCGKTTLLNCLSGIDDLTEGTVVIEGQDLSTLSDDKKTEYRAQRIGFVFQAYNLIPVLSAIENVELPLLVSGTKEKAARKNAEKTLDMVELLDWKDHKPSELSGGQQQRVTIARALVNEPAIVFGDEPTGNLDRANSNAIMELLCRLNKENEQTFVLVTHDKKVGKMTERILWMDSGNITKETVPTRLQQI